MFIRYMILICLTLITINTYATESKNILVDMDNEKSATEMLQKENAVTTKAEYRKIQEFHRFYLIVALIVMTPIFLMILLYFIRKSNEYTEHAIIHASGLVLVIQSTTIVVIAAPTTEQLTAAIGVLAAIAGYLFGAAKVTRKES